MISFEFARNAIKNKSSHMYLLCNCTKPKQSKSITINVIILLHGEILSLSFFLLLMIQQIWIYTRHEGNRPRSQQRLRHLYRNYRVQEERAEEIFDRISDNSFSYTDVRSDAGDKRDEENVENKSESSQAGNLENIFGRMKGIKQVLSIKAPRLRRGFKFSQRAFNLVC